MTCVRDRFIRMNSFYIFLHILEDFECNDLNLQYPKHFSEATAKQQQHIIISGERSMKRNERFSFNDFVQWKPRVVGFEIHRLKKVYYPPWIKVYNSLCVL